MYAILQRHCSAYPVEIEKLFRLMVFNYVFSNGDAHLKNFSLCESIDGDYILTPAYDLVCTSMHLPNEARTALDLFDDFESPFYSQNGFYGADDLLQLGKVFGIQHHRAEAIIMRFADAQDRTVDLIERSFLSDEAKADYRHRLDDRLKAICMAS